MTIAAESGFGRGERVQINGLPLPRALILAMQERRWRCPAEPVLRRVFRDRPVRVRFYDLVAMREENLVWRDEKDPAYFGHVDQKSPPGDIDPTRSLLLGALGPHLPFALDFRVSNEAPRVLYLHPGDDRWITVAGGVEQLLARLNLDVPRAPR